MIPDTLAIAPAYARTRSTGARAVGRYIAWGVFENESMEMNDRYLPAGVLDDEASTSPMSRRA